MLVSIVITNYNYGDYLASAIESALNQPYPDKEIIVVDDGSTDQSAQVIAGYGNSIIAVFKENAGHCAAANTGFAISRGEIVIFLDADDYLAEDAVSALAGPIRMDSRVSRSQGYLREIDKGGTPTGRLIPIKLLPSGNYRDETLRRGPGACLHTFTSGNAWARWFLREVMPLPEKKNLGVDSCLNAVSTLFGASASVDRIVGAYRLHDRNVGPTSTRFNAASIRRRLRQIECTRDYLAHWTRRLGYATPVEEWRWGRKNWRHCLLRYSLTSLRGDPPGDSFGEFVRSPFYTNHTNKPKAVILSAVLCLIWLLPRNGDLALARRMLKLPNPSTSGTEPGP
jgi:glycosyltransferase involved in cell wall biosynthesis